MPPTDPDRRIATGHTARVDKVVLRHGSDASGARHLEARREPDGWIVIEGQDLGPGVTAIFGEGLTEYEWWWRLAPEHVPAAVAALGGAHGEDAIRVIDRWFAANGGGDPGSHLREAGVPIAFDSRIGD